MKTPVVLLCALAATTLAACSPSTGGTEAATSTVTTVIATPTPAAPPVLPSTPATTVTVTAPRVTVTPPPVTHDAPASGPFQSPSGNIRCTMFTSTDGRGNARCAAVQHDWVATEPPNCRLNWGDRVDLEEGSAATYGCYGQDMPAPTHTLAYGQTQTLGAFTCRSETDGIMCLDTATGHYFSVSRETAHLG